jgi:hypothetical protein
MNYAKLKKHLNALAGLPTTDTPLISSFLDLSRGNVAAVRDFQAWTELTRQTFAGEQRQAFDDAAEEIESWIMKANGRSAAVFCRWGEHPLFLPMEFEVPLETRHHVADLAVIYPLVELKDRFNRFVVVLTTANSARIVEVNLGSQSIELLTERPALRERIGREWTREHYASHRRERDRRFVKDKIAVIEGLMAKRGHNSLIIAGDPRYVNRLTEALPGSLKNKLIGEIKTGISDDRLQDVIGQALDSFLKAEAEEAHDTVELLVNSVRAGGLAVVGVESTRRAIAEGRAERLVVSSTLTAEDQEDLVRLASQLDVGIETVQDCEMLDRNGGAGALLRYRLPGYEGWASLREPNEELVRNY